MNRYPIGHGDGVIYLFPPWVCRPLGASAPNRWGTCPRLRGAAAGKWRGTAPGGGGGGERVTGLHRRCPSLPSEPNIETCSFLGPAGLMATPSQWKVLPLVYHRPLFIITAWISTPCFLTDHASPLPCPCSRCAPSPPPLPPHPRRAPLPPIPRARCQSLSPLPPCPPLSPLPNELQDAARCHHLRRRAALLTTPPPLPAPAPVLYPPRPSSGRGAHSGRRHQRAEEHRQLHFMI